MTERTNVESSVSRLVLPSEGEGLQVVASVSGGKDSTALILALREAEIPARYVFADTAWEANETYDYLDMLRERLGITINVVGPASRGMVGKIRENARFPSRMQRWCTRELKIEPLREYHDRLIAETGVETICAMGVRAEESEERAKMPEWELEEAGDRAWGGWLWRPLIDWKIADVLAIHHRHGIPVNPLYQRGHDRVGCYPCIFAQKEEIRLIAKHSPERIDEIEALEDEASKERFYRNWDHAIEQFRKDVALLARGKYPWKDHTGPKPRYNHEQASYFLSRTGAAVKIREVVEWSKTTRGGKQYDLLHLLQEPPRGGCMKWGLCEAPPKKVSAA
jgi:3'-phosphoadenosine 5'-phosphosulfate sulfotransferase (PAPS reductase)/FAD synthetase